MWFNLWEYGPICVTGCVDYPGGNPSKAYLDRVINEAKRVGKIPWCASGWHELAAAEILGFECETREETLKRRSMES